MTTIYARRAAVTQKVESSYGTDSTPAADTDALMVHNLKIDPLKTAAVPRNPVMTFFGNQGKLIASQMAEVSYDVELAGAGAAGTAAPYAAALKSCALAQTLTVATDAQYDPISSSVQSSTLYFYESGVLHKITGMLMNAVFNIKAGGNPMISFRGVGLHNAFTDVSLITPTLTGFQIPLPVNKANTGTFTLHSFAGVFREMSLDLGNNIQYRNAPNLEQVRFVGRNATGKVTLEKDLVAGKDWQVIVKAGTTGALAVLHGTTAGNKCQLQAPAVQLHNYTESEDDGVKLISMDMELRPTSAGNNEFKLTVF